MQPRVSRKVSVLACLTMILCLALVSPLGQGVAEANSHENASIWRLQIRLMTGNVSDAGTDDSVSVLLAQGNLTWLDYGRDDFERGDDFTYDLMLDRINRIGDISFIRIAKSGSNGWCVRGLILLINGRPIYEHYFQTGAAPCLWLDNSGGRSNVVTIPGNQLRAYKLWQEFTPPTPSPLLTRAEIESRIEGMVGHQMTVAGKKLKWGKLHGRAVEAARKDDTTLHVDLDLKYPIRLFPDLEVDVDFDLGFSCSAGVVSVAVSNVKVKADSAWYTEILSLGLVEFLDDHASKKIAKALGEQLKSMSQPLNPRAPLRACPPITVQSSGDVRFF